MRIHRLDLQQFRGFSSASIDFDPGFTLLVGENGTGKSSILWALRVALSHILDEISPSQERVLQFTESDIANGETQNWPFLNVTMEYGIAEHERHFLFFSQKSRGEFVASKPGEVREQTLVTPDRSEFFELGPKHERLPLQHLPRSKRAPAPLAVFYSSRRSYITEQRSSSIGRISGNEARAYANALDDRPVVLADMVDLWRKEAVLSETDRIPDRANQAIQHALPEFLEGFSDLHLDEREGRAQIRLKKWGVPLNLSQLSDGERSLLTFLMDLTRRLALANPGLTDPARNGTAVVLIDEIEMHLHPRWQRSIVGKLSQTFPRTQFIATTHSPQVIGETKTNGLVLLEKSDSNLIVTDSNASAYGFDSSWILRHLMDTESRPVEVREQIEKIESSLESGDLDEARKRLEVLREALPFDDDEVKRLEASINNLEALADEVDNDEVDK